MSEGSDAGVAAGQGAVSFALPLGKQSSSLETPVPATTSTTTVPTVPITATPALCCWHEIFHPVRNGEKNQRERRGGLNSPCWRVKKLLGKGHWKKLRAD